MPFVQRQISGEAWAPRSQDLNSFARSANSIGRIGAGNAHEPLQRNITVTVYNAGSSALPFGCAVQMKSGADEEPFPVEAVSDTSKFYGVLTTPLASGQIGAMIVSGVANLGVAVNGEFAMPSGTSWVANSYSGLQVINPAGGRAYAVIGGGANGNDIYNGPFAVSFDSESNMLHVNAGWASFNGTWVSVSAADIAPSVGYVCLQTSLDTSTGAWSSPVIKISRSAGQFLYPVARIEYNDNTYKIENFRIPVVIIIAASYCPYTQLP